MSIRQNLAILFFLKRGKITQEGKAPIYVRITIDGLKEQISTGCKVCADAWDPKTKQVLPIDKSYKQLNKALGPDKNRP